MYLTHLEAKRHKSNTLWGNHMCLPLCSSLEPPILSWQKPVVGKLFQKLSRNLSIFFLLFFFICSSLLTPNLLFIISVVQFTCSGMFESLWPHGLQHARPPCPSPTPGVYSNSCPLSRWCHPTISSSVFPSPTFNLSQHQGLFKWVRSLHQVVKVLEFQLQHQSSIEYPGLISFRMDCLDLLAVQGILQSLLQHQSSKASILWRSAFFIVQLSHP